MLRDARYTGTGKIPVSIIFQKVRYHNFAHFGISYAAVRSASQIAANPVNLTKEQRDGSNRLNSINAPEINK